MSATISNPSASGPLFTIGQTVTIGTVQVLVTNVRVLDQRLVGWSWEYDALADRYHLRVVGFPP